MDRTGSAPIETLTSGASCRIIPVFHRSVIYLRSLLRVLLFFQSILFWFLLLPRRGARRNALPRPPASPPSSPRPSARRRPGGRFRRAAEADEARRRRALAEGLEVDGGESFVIEGRRRNALFCRSWAPLAGDLKGILVVIHGLNEHSGRYTQFAKQLTLSNFGVYAMDWTGHGGSDGLHGYVPSLDCVAADIGIFLEKIKSENPGVPYFLFGHSTGGAVVLKAALRPHIEAMLEGVILTSPALRVKPAHAIVGAVAPLFSLVVPKYAFKGANKRGIPVSRDPAAMLAKYSDPLVYTGPIRVRTGHEILRISSYLTQNLRLVTVPFLVLHGTADRVTDPLASQELYNEAASRYKDIKLYEGFLHDLLFEPERDEIGADIINWMERRLQQQSLI